MFCLEIGIPDCNQDLGDIFAVNNINKNLCNLNAMQLLMCTLLLLEIFYC